jgi:hypothetical protein
MTARHVGGHKYVVTNRESGGVYEVNLREMTCTCEDMAYNQHGNEACKHYFYAHHVSPKVRLSVEDGYTQDMARLLIKLNETVSDARDAASEFEGALIQQRDAETDTAAQTASQTTTDDSPPGRDVDVDAAAHRLQSAYDDVVEDMEVQVHEGWVWIQTGRDTPETLPGPGNVEVFTAFLANPDPVEYIHDDHDAVSQKPGEWWKNRIAPEAVDDYIEEVLE